jgi:putative ABC transport system ATP-binding protein
MLADEPTASLDDAAAAQAAQLLAQVAAQQGATLVVASHDARLLQYFTQAGPVRVLNLAAPQIAGVARVAA